MLNVRNNEPFNIENAFLFEELPATVRADIIAGGTPLKVPKDTCVYRQGDTARRFYLIADGEVELVMHTDRGGRRIVGHIGPGGHFGETAMLTKSCHSVDARALKDLAVIAFDQKYFIKCLLHNQTIKHRLCIALANRLRLAFRDQAKCSPPSIQTQSPPATLPDRCQLSESSLSRRIRNLVEIFGESLDPVLLSGEIGTGRRMIAHRIHQSGMTAKGPYLEIDILDIPGSQLAAKIFGRDNSTAPFSQAGRPGILEKAAGGTVVLYSAEHLEPDIQHHLVDLLKKGTYRKIGGGTDIFLHARIILICRDSPGTRDSQDMLLPPLVSLISDRQLCIPPLRDNRRDLPGLADYYLQHYSLLYGKDINRVDKSTLGMIMNYDWPGNLDEMATVIQRAVILADDNRTLHSGIFLGVPKPEGKWEFNLLRLQPVKALFIHPLYPELPRLAVGFLLMFILGMLIFGPQQPDNLGLTLSWEVGWPLLLSSFFFLARTWCSVCGLALPGRLAQMATKPARPTPKFLRRYSGWFVAALCITLFWVELTWDASSSPGLTAGILLAISSGGLIFSMLFQRRVWCRYLCPLGALNALFSMSSILELRANSHMCMNHCTEHTCYKGTDNASGCPMFRHPFMVDNNRDCIICGQCIKNCSRESIHLNLRLAPQELWNQRKPRLEDAFLIVSLAAIFIPFAMAQVSRITPPGGDTPIYYSLFFFGNILLHLIGYLLYASVMAGITGSRIKSAAAALSYGFIPLILAAFLSAYLELFVRGFPQVTAWLGIISQPGRIISHDATLVLQAITMTGGLLAAVFATQNIIRRLLDKAGANRKMIIPCLLQLSLAVFYMTLLW